MGTRLWDLLPAWQLSKCRIIEGGNEVYLPSFAILTTPEEIAYREPE
jgi:hypothetical protein